VPLTQEYQTRSWRTFDVSAMLLSDLMLKSPFPGLGADVARWSLLSCEHNIRVSSNIEALTQTTSDLIPSTLHEQTQTIVLVVQNGEQLIRKGLPDAISSARYRDSSAIARCGVHLDQSFDAIVINVVYIHALATRQQPSACNAIRHKTAKNMTSIRA